LRHIDFSNSIDPTTIPKTNEEIKQLLSCLTKDARSYVDSTRHSNSLVSHFRTAILPKLEQKKLADTLVEKLDKYAAAELSRTTFVMSSYTKFLEKTREDIEWWMDKYSREAKRRRRESETLELNDLIDLEKIAYQDFVSLSVLLSQMFFALEFSCRMVCGIGCYRFAIRIIRSEVIQHKELWKQLKRLGEKTGGDCEVCAVKESCDFRINFLALARLYAYATKVRQIVDYTTKLASLNIFKSGLFEPPFPYFSHLSKVVESNFLLVQKSLPHRLLSSFSARFSFQINTRKELYAPFSWDEKELRRLTAKQSKDALSWYLLGKLYFKRDAAFEAIECLQKAKTINPKNPEAWHLLGILYGASGETLQDELKALRHLERARELEPNDVEILFEVSAMYLGLGKTLKAIEYLKEARKIPTTLGNLCALNQALYEAYSLIGDLTRANTYLEKAKKLDDDYQKRLENWFKGFLEERREFRKHLRSA